MNILLIAPQPFYQERGTPIAVNMLLKSLSRRPGTQVDVLAYHEGTDVSYPNVTLHRTCAVPGTHNVRPGFSVKKLMLDVFLTFKALRMAARRRYDVVHAVEESVFIAMLIKMFFGVPYVYDMDSSMPMQMIETHPKMGFLASLMRAFEGAAVRKAVLVVPVCESLASMATAYGAAKVMILTDVSLLQPGAESKENLRERYGISGFCFVYVGNLEPYQGIDLMLESFALFLKDMKAHLVIIGGTEQHIKQYTILSQRLGIDANVQFTGPRPLDVMADAFHCADVLVSPRITGNNTPMKLYSYIASGKPVLATRIASHTQVLTDETALLEVPSPALFATAMKRLASEASLRRRLADNAAALAREQYSLTAFDRRANSIYDWIASQIPPSGTGL
jgi:glycosyltransferase involved in cell wall biosynthesis